jgi:GntR family transcriptional regulator
MQQRPIALTLHRQLRDLIVARIESGEWSPGTYLPSETRLADDYGVAVGTLRKALLDLAAEGVVQRRQGKGTVVASHDSDQVLFRFFNLRRADGSFLRPESRVLDRRRAPRARTRPRRSGSTRARTCSHHPRPRRRRHGPSSTSTSSSTPRASARSRPAPDPLPNTLYQLYQSQFGATVHRARETITATPATEPCAGELGLPPGAPLLRIRRSRSTSTATRSNSASPG